MNKNTAGRIVVALALGFASVHALAQGAWRQGPPIPEGANEVLGANVNGSLLVYGGQGTKNEPMGILWKFDPDANKWTQLKGNSLPVHHAAIAAVGNKLYLFGGFRLPGSDKPGWTLDDGTPKIGWWPESKTWVYDLDKQAWSALAPMPTPRGALAAVAVGTKVYVVGGAKIPEGVNAPTGLIPGGPAELVGTLEVYDTVANTWKSLRSMSLPRNHHSVEYLDGKLYAMGGRVGSSYSGGWSSNVSMNEAYDIATDTWSQRAPMPTPRSGTAIAVLEGKIYVLGGEAWIEEFGGVYRANEAYDPKTNTWTKAARMPTPRHGLATAVINGTLYAVSGVNNAGGAGTLSIVAVNEIFEVK